MKTQTTAAGVTVTADKEETDLRKGKLVLGKVEIVVTDGKFTVREMYEYQPARGAQRSLYVTGDTVRTKTSRFPSFVDVAIYLRGVFGPDTHLGA